MRYIIFSKINKNYLLFFTYLIVSIIDEICNRYVKTTGDIIEIFHNNYIYSISDFLSIIPIIIIKIRTKDISKNKLIKENTKENNQDSNFGIKYIYLDANVKNRKKRRKRIIIISIFDFFAININIIFKVIFYKYYFLVHREGLNSIILFSIISNYVLSILILHSPFYRHHLVSMIINLLFLTILIVLDIINIVNGNISYPYIIVEIITVILYSFEDAFAKILFSIDSISPYNYLLYRGILVNSFTLIFSIVFIFVELPDEKGENSCIFSRFWKLYEDKLNILIYLIKFFNDFLINLNIFLIIDKFSLIHFAMASIIQNFGSLLISIIFEEITIGNFFLKFGIYFILIIFALVYNEFIILNFCGLERYTQLFLQKEANNDIQQTIVNNNDDFFSEDDNIKQCEMVNNKENLGNDIIE